MKKVLHPQSRILSDIPRWPVVRTIKKQSVAEHSYYVTLYALGLAQYLDWPKDLLYEVTQYAMIHDFEEMITSDIPPPFEANIKYDRKQIQEQISNYTPAAGREPLCTVEDLVKIADIFEAVMFLKDEQQLGNKGVSLIYRNLAIKLESHISAFTDKYEYLTLTWMDECPVIPEKKSIEELLLPYYTMDVRFNHLTDKGLHDE